MDRAQCKFGEKETRSEQQGERQTEKKRYQIECETGGGGAAVVIFMKSRVSHATLKFMSCQATGAVWERGFTRFVAALSSCMYAAGGDR